MRPNANTIRARAARRGASRLASAVDPVLSSTLLKLALPLAATAIGLLVARKRRMSLRDDVGLRPPRPLAMLAWLAGWGVWMWVSELLIAALDLEQPSPWPAYPPYIVILRIVAIGMAGPLCEEVLARGVVLGRLRHTRLGPALAVAVVAVAWAALHYGYGPGLVALIAVDGVWLGAARLLGASLWIPIAMHMAANLFSIYQSLTT